MAYQWKSSPTEGRNSAPKFQKKSSNVWELCIWRQLHTIHSATVKPKLQTKPLPIICQNTLIKRHWFGNCTSRHWCLHTTCHFTTQFRIRHTFLHKGSRPDSQHSSRRIWTGSSMEKTQPTSWRKDNNMQDKLLSKTTSMQPVKCKSNSTGRPNPTVLRQISGYFSGISPF